MRNTLASMVVALSLLVCNSLLADQIMLVDGSAFQGEVTEYVDQHVRIELPDGKILIRKVTEIERIAFDRPGAETEANGERLSPAMATIHRALANAIAEAKESLTNKSRPTAVVAMYLDTEDPDAQLPDNEVEYRCYSGGGYSGIHRVPLRQAFARRESVRTTRDGTQRIQIDPGPPYKIVNRHVTLKAGEAVNLGRILLEKEVYEGTASIYGTVRDAFGEPLPGVRVTAGERDFVSDADGRYHLDGFELEQVSIQAKAKGYRGGAAQVSIRDMKMREIKQDLSMFRPRRVKLKYVISAKEDFSFEGSDVEKGSIDLVVNSSRTDLSRYHHNSDSFREFAADTRLNLRFEQGELKLANYMAPIFFQESAAGVEFDAIQSMGRVGINQQFCPPLEEGKVVLIRGFQLGQKRGVSEYCVKVLVEEISFEQSDVAVE